MSDLLFLNFFSIGALIPVVFVAFVALLLGRIRQKSGATVWLVLFALTYSLFMLPYFPAASVYHPAGAFHRWFTVFFVLLTQLCLSQFFFHLPENTHPRIARGFLIGQTIGALLVGGFFIWKTMHAGRVYHFDGHYWDFDADELSRQVGLVIALYLAIFLGTGIFRIIVGKGHRLPLIGMFLSFAVCMVLPTITNVASRDGALDRGTHQTVIVMANVIGCFGAIIIYLNTTRDRTTFMAKLIGITLITFLFVFQGLNYFFLSEKEEAYDDLRRKDADLMLATQYRAPDLKYAISWGEDQPPKLLFGEMPSVDFHHYSTEAANTAMLERIASISYTSRAQYNSETRKVFAEAHPGFGGYAAFITKFLEAAPEGDPRPALLERLHSMRRQILFRQNKIKQIPDSGFEAGLKKFLQGQPEWFLPFSQAMQKHAAENAAAEPARLKSDTLKFLAPMERAGVRLYRKDLHMNTGADAYVAFIRQDPVKGRMLEVGYSYSAYRAYVHPVALKLTLLLVAVVVVVLAGFRFFFLGALVRPLNALLSGVEKVNGGDMSVSVPIKVEDEIGFLSRSFNGMVVSIKDARARLQEYAEDLEVKVEKRTEELTTTLGQVQELKKQQDGDYFLTSLLIKPLATNHAKSDTVQVDFLLEQKKKFQFRKWDSEIGGDICMANSIKLRGRPYTVFLNADAMGKSIQGAGGALVLGSVFESIVERTVLVESMQEYSPERWLKNAFIELHKVFESFEGSMLISLITGLVDDVTGLLYYINAEHPWTVLYRGGKARFIEEELMLRKLGTQGMEGGVSVQIFQLEPADVLIAGSDGRDDILIGTREDGERIINEDEHAFLKHVEISQGSLQSIYRSLEKVGELTDDLSLVRVSYREVGKPVRSNEDRVNLLLQRARAAIGLENYEEALPLLNEALALDSSATEVIQELIRIHYNQGNFKKASDYADDYIDLRPAESEILYLAAVCHRRSKNPQRALDLAERLRLRESKRVEVLGLLAELHAELGNTSRAEAMMKAGRAINPDHSAVKKAADVIEALTAKPA